MEYRIIEADGTWASFGGIRRKFDTAQEAEQFLTRRSKFFSTFGQSVQEFDEAAELEMAQAQAKERIANTTFDYARYGTE